MGKEKMKSTMERGAQTRSSAPARPPRNDVRLALVAVAASMALAGCVKRTILIESEPPGAKVWINQNDQPAGTTPLTHEFITHGRYKFRLEKKGFEPLVVRERVRAPIYQWIPLDFFFENLIPAKLEDKHAFRYVLAPESAQAHLVVETQPDLEKAVADLEAADPEIRLRACFALARRRDPSTAEPLRKATWDSSPKVRAAALSALRGLEGVRALERLTQALGGDPDPQVRWQAAVEMEALKSHEAVPALMEALKDKDPLVRAGAAEGLKGIPDPRAVDLLIRALRDKDTSVRRSATEALGLIGERSAVKPLTRALFYHDFQTRRRAVESLARLRDPDSSLALANTFTDWDPQVRRKATEALIAFGDDRAVPLLIRRLRGLKPWTREHAALALGGMKSRTAVEPLKVAFAKEPNPEARAAMQKALADIQSAQNPVQ